MIYKLELDAEEAALLVKILANKAKEIHAWQAATNDTRRQDEYHGVTGLLKKIHIQERD